MHRHLHYFFKEKVGSSPTNSGDSTMVAGSQDTAYATLQSCQSNGCIKIWKHAWCSLLFTRLSCETLNIVCTARRRKWQTGPDGKGSQPRRRRTHMSLWHYHVPTYLASLWLLILILALSDQFGKLSFCVTVHGIWCSKVTIILFVVIIFFSLILVS